MLLLSCRPSSGHILEALHVDPASGVSLDKEKSSKVSKPAVSTTSALAKLTKGSTSGGPSKQVQGEKKETPQERLKRIMNRQLNKQIKKDTAAEMAKKREQERQRLEKLAETSRLSRQRHRSRSRSYKDIDGVEVQVGVGVLEDTILVHAHVHDLGPTLTLAPVLGKKPFKVLKAIAAPEKVAGRKLLL
ncbi:hypothetical protein QQP08_003384 [Theobroma cacao]|nr:hypothetical protein QQP08_003384 [Theobroma cacao]